MVVGRRVRDGLEEEKGGTVWDFFFIFLEKRGIDLLIFCKTKLQCDINLYEVDRINPPCQESELHVVSEVLKTPVLTKFRYLIETSWSREGRDVKTEQVQVSTGYSA